MTDSQVKYQAFAEDQRHNLAMEEFSKQEQESKRLQSEASWLQAQNSTVQAQAAMAQAGASILNARTNRINALTRQAELENSKTKVGWDIGFGLASFLIPDANTALSSAAKVVTSLFS